MNKSKESQCDLQEYIKLINSRVNGVSEGEERKKEGREFILKNNS